MRTAAHSHQCRCSQQNQWDSELTLLHSTSPLCSGLGLPVVQNQLQSQLAGVTFRVSEHTATGLQMIKRTKTFDLNYSFSAAHDGIQRRQPLQQPSILNGLNAPVPAMDRRPARSSGSGRGSHRKPEKNSRDALQESGCVPTRNNASVNVPRVNSRSKQRVCHACKQRDDGYLVVGCLELLEWWTRNSTPGHNAV